MSILIVGGAGYIGSQTAKLVAAAGLEPIVFDNLVYGHEWAVKWGPLVRGDLADRALLVDVMKRHRVDAGPALIRTGRSVSRIRPFHRTFQNCNGVSLRNGRMWPFDRAARSPNVGECVTSAATVGSEEPAEQSLS